MGRLFFLILCFCGQNPKAQEKQIFACNYGFQKATNPNCSIVSSSINSDVDAIQVVDKILEPIGLKRNFVLVSCSDINNALAITSNTGIRYIVYDKKFISSLKQLSSDWTNASILAHEIGHHLLGHTLRASVSLEEQRQKELDADEFSGFILFKLGATLPQSQAPINLISNDASDINSTHPSRSKRLLAIKAGYEKANSSQVIKYINTGPIPETFFNKAIKLTDEGKYEEALDNYTTAIGINPKFAEAYMNRAQVRFQLPVEIRNLSEIIHDCNKAIQLNPKLGIAYYNRGVAEMLNNEYKLALNDFNFAIKLDPSIDGHQFSLNREFVKQKIKDEEKSVSELDKDIAKNPNNAFAYFQRGKQKLEINKYQDAILDFTKAIEKDKRNPAFFDFRGYAKGSLGLYGEAIKDFDTSIRLNPNIYIPYFHRGSTYKKLEDFNKG
ncbi:MAG: tetratricopeptide repeat protein [Bacteroidota bacterium]|nr:tetratricopeptide repeat protein [Bacteroidota bacterium]